MKNIFAESQLVFINLCSIYLSIRPNQSSIFNLGAKEYTQSVNKAKKEEEKLKIIFRNFTVDEANDYQQQQHQQ